MANNKMVIFNMMACIKVNFLSKISIYSVVDKVNIT